MYLETPDGGHTGLLGIFYAPPVYEFLFDHALNVPEPSSLILATWSLSALAAVRRRQTTLNLGHLALLP